jgi:hypothetical protein
MRTALLPFCVLSLALLAGCADLLGVEPLSGSDGGEEGEGDGDGGDGAPSATDGGLDLPDGCRADWVDASSGVVPPGAIPNHPLDDSGLAIFVCHAASGSDVLPGKLRPGWGCYFGDGDGGEVLATDYQALVPTGCTAVWKTAPDGYEPVHVVPCGQDSQGPLYSCRVTQAGMYKDELGRIGWGTSHQCVYSYAMQSYSTVDFEVLTLQ